MGRRIGAPAAALVVVSLLVAGCGGNETSGMVENDAGKNPDLMKAMGGYMEKRAGAKPARGKAASGAAKPAAAAGS